jgi:hypothetical protein
MNRPGSTYRWLAALMSAVLLLGGVLPGLQGLCAEMASAASQQTAALHAEAEAVGHGHSSSHACEGECAGLTCCASLSSYTDRLDLRLPDRGATADLLRRRRVEPVVSPAPDRDNSVWVRDLDSDPVSSVRRHVWTATFLS